MDAYQLHQFQQAMRSRGLNPSDPNHISYFQNLMIQQQRAQQPMYAANRTGLPVNITNGGVVTETRGIFVSHLSFKANEAAINAYFSVAGPIISLALQRDHQTKKSKGNCTIQFDSVISAQKAIAMFDNKPFMNMRLQVRADRECTAKDAPSAGPAPPPAPPLIVSSTPTQSRRRG